MQQITVSRANGDPIYRIYFISFRVLFSNIVVCTLLIGFHEKNPNYKTCAYGKGGGGSDYDCLLGDGRAGTDQTVAAMVSLVT